MRYNHAMPNAQANPVLVEVSRSGRVESEHRGAVVVWHDDEVLLACGDVERPVFARSATKPLQALPFLERGLHRQYQLEARHVAVLCASHAGADEHLAAVREVLARAGLREEQLQCGPHAPFDDAARRALFAAGQRPGRIHNNCSGKHAGFLALALACGDDPANYLEPGCKAQQEVARAVQAMAGLAEPAWTGLDGCGAPTFWLPLVALAKAFARLANPIGMPPVRSEACRTILAAAAQAPSLLEGRGMLCTEIVKALPGTSFAKNGAEGVYALALAPEPRRRRCPGAVGVAVKIDDGSQRAYPPVVVEVLRWLGAFAGAEVPPALATFWRTPVGNTQQKVVGEVRCALELPR